MSISDGKIAETLKETDLAQDLSKAGQNSDSVRLVKEFLDTELFSLGDTALTPGSLIAFFIILFLTFRLSALAQRVVSRGLSRSGVVESGTHAVASRLVRYGIILIGLCVALETVGIDLGALFAAGAVFAVGIGFAMQNIVQNFVSGVILLLERTIKPGDILEVEGQVVRVVEMGIRATVARSRDEEELIIPNSTLVQGTVKNFTLHDRVFRLKAFVGVDYGSDLAKVMGVLLRAAEALPFRLPERPPQVLLTAFASSSVDFEIQVWVNDPWGARSLQSEVNIALWNALKAEGIVIAFPQVDVHLAPSVESSLSEVLPKLAVTAN